MKIMKNGNKMANSGIDKWCLRMEEHRRKGHHILRNNEMEQSILIKEKRVSLLEKHHSILSSKDLLSELEVKT